MAADGDHVLTRSGVRVYNVKLCTWPKVLCTGSKLCSIRAIPSLGNDVCNNTPDRLGHALFSHEITVHRSPNGSFRRRGEAASECKRRLSLNLVTISSLAFNTNSIPNLKFFFGSQTFFQNFVDIWEITIVMITTKFD